MSRVTVLQNIVLKVEACHYAWPQALSKHILDDDMEGMPKEGTPKGLTSKDHRSVSSRSVGQKSVRQKKDRQRTGHFIKSFSAPPSLCFRMLFLASKLHAEVYLKVINSPLQSSSNIRNYQTSRAHTRTLLPTHTHPYTYRTRRETRKRKHSNM